VIDQFDGGGRFEDHDRTAMGGDLGDASGEGETLA